MSTVEKEPLLETQTAVDTRFTHNVLLILPPVIVYYLAESLYLYVSSEWIQHYEQTRIFPDDNITTSSKCGDVNKSDPDYKLYEQVETETAKWQMLAGNALLIPTAIVMTVLTSYSDRYGRKFVLILGISGALLKICVATVTVYYNLHPLYIVIASVVAGCTGSMYAVLSACYSCMADITTVGQQRTIALTLHDGVCMICVTLGALGSGYFVKYTGYFIPTATCCGMTACSFLLIWFVVPETYPKHMRLKTRSVCTVFKGTFRFYVSDTFKGKRIAYLLLLTAYIIENLVNGSRAGLELLYQLGRPFCWSPDKIGVFSALRHVPQGLAGIFLIRPLQFCLPDTNIAILSMIFATGSFVLEGLARTDLMLYMVTVVASLAYLCESMIKGLMSTITPTDAQGALFSGITMTQVISTIVSGFLFNSIYASTVSFMSGFIFLLQAGLSLVTIAILVVFLVTSGHVLRMEKDTSTNNTDA